MLNWHRTAMLVCLEISFLILVTTGSRAAQAQSPLVVFVVDRDLRTASNSNYGPEGLSRMGEVFEALGAHTQAIDLTQPIPDEASVVVLVGPQLSLSTSALAHLWAHMAQGNNLLLAIDPNGYQGVFTDTSESGLAGLLALDFSVGLHDEIINAPWNTFETLNRRETSFGYVDASAHPLLAPLAAFHMPMRVWGARVVSADPASSTSISFPLLYSGETALGVVAENFESGARVAVLGDSELLLNNYGLDVRSAIDTSENLDARRRYAGNWLFAERLAAWLLDLPEDQWRDLPPDFTQIVLDGDDRDWASVVTPRYLSSDENIAARSFYDDSYLYVLFTQESPMSTGAQITIELTRTDSASTATLTGTHTFALRIIANSEQIIVQEQAETAASAARPTGMVLPDAALAINEVIELRLPLRVTGREPVIQSLCIAAEASAESVCPIEAPLTPTHHHTRAPVDNFLTDNPLVTLNARGNIPLYAQPDNTLPAIDNLVTGTTLSAIARDDSGTWLHVQNARSDGWLNLSDGVLNGAIEYLPIAAN